MIVNDQCIITPRDDPASFELAWRHKVAVAATSTPTTRIPFILAEDAELLRYAAHLRRRNKVTLKHGDPLTAYDRVAGWHDQHIGRLVEAYLLTHATVQEIAAEIGLDVADIALYGALFFDVRGPDGSVRRGVLVRLRSELTDEVDENTRLKRAALLGGLPLLRKLTRSVVDDKPADILSALVDQEIARRVVSQQMGVRDLARLQANNLLRERVRHETADTQASQHAGWEFSLKLLGAVAPHMVVKPQQTAESVATANDQIQSRLRAQINVQNTHVEDNEERGNEAMDDLLRKSFALKPE